MEVESQFFEERAIALATVLLTRHPDVTVNHRMLSTREAGYDLEVRIGPKGTPTARMFAVEVKAKRTLAEIGKTTPDHKQVILKEPLRRSLAHGDVWMRELPFPVLYIVFAMNTDDAYFGWLTEPVPNTTRLLAPEVRLAALWSPQTHDVVIGRVKKWYEIRGQAPKAAG